MASITTAGLLVINIILGLAAESCGLELRAVVVEHFSIGRPPVRRGTPVDVITPQPLLAYDKTLVADGDTSLLALGGVPIRSVAILDGLVGITVTPDLTGLILERETVCRAGVGGTDDDPVVAKAGVASSVLVLRGS